VSTTIYLADSSDRAAWLEARRKGISASDVACVLGYGYSSRNKLLQEKSGLGDYSDDLGQMSQVQAGRHFEAGLLAWFAEDHQLEYRGVLGCGTLMARSDRQWLMATPDALAINISGDVLDRTPVELKVVGLETRANWHENSLDTKGWPKDFPLPEPLEVQTKYPRVNLKVAAAHQGTVKGTFRQAVAELYTQHIPALGAPRAPLKYWTQLQVQMYVLGASEGWVSVCVGGTSRIDLRYAFDSAFMDFVVSECETFLEELNG
jgi:hypothetical protein